MCVYYMNSRVTKYGKETVKSRTADTLPIEFLLFRNRVGEIRRSTYQRIDWQINICKEPH